jgi:hypothetical protein
VQESLKQYKNQTDVWPVTVTFPTGTNLIATATLKEIMTKRGALTGAPRFQI